MPHWRICLSTHRKLRRAISQKVGTSRLKNNWRWTHQLKLYIAQSQGHNIRRYAEYLMTRAKAFDATKTDYVRSGPGRLKRLSVDKGLLRETEVVQRQIRALLRCDVSTASVPILGAIAYTQGSF